MPPVIKKILLWVVFVFTIYAIVTSPERAADVAQAIWDIIFTGLRNIGRFFTSLIE